MFERQEIKSSQKVFQHEIVVLVLFVALLGILIEYASLLYRRAQVEEKKQWFVEEVKQFEKSNQELAKQYEYDKTEYFLRKEAKRKLNKKEAGEKVIVLSGKEEGTEEDEGVVPLSIPALWWNYLFGDTKAESTGL